MHLHTLSKWFLMIWLVFIKLASFYLSTSTWFITWHIFIFCFPFANFPHYIWIRISFSFFYHRPILVVFTQSIDPISIHFLQCIHNNKHTKYTWRSVWIPLDSLFTNSTLLCTKTIAHANFRHNLLPCLHCPFQKWGSHLNWCHHY